MSHQPPGASGQRKRLIRLLEFATDPTPGKCNFGAMIIMSPPGDVCFLAPIAPELRGVEIVAASSPCDDGKDYDIWMRGSRKGMVESNLTAAQVVDWLNERGRHSEAEYIANGAAWTEDALRFYGVKSC